MNSNGNLWNKWKWNFIFFGFYFLNYFDTTSETPMVSFRVFTCFPFAGSVYNLVSLILFGLIDKWNYFQSLVTPKTSDIPTVSSLHKSKKKNFNSLHGKLVSIIRKNSKNMFKKLKKYFDRQRHVISIISRTHSQQQAATFWNFSVSNLVHQVIQFSDVIVQKFTFMFCFIRILIKIFASLTKQKFKLFSTVSFNKNIQAIVQFCGTLLCSS